MSGGITLYVNKKIGENTVEVKNKMKEVLWVKINNKGEKIIIGSAYRNPDYSKYENTSFFEKLEEEIQEIKKEYGNYKMMLVGDFNARVGLLDDLQRFEHPGDTWEEEQIKVEGRIKDRENEDKTINAAGRKLIGLCKNIGMILLNGRTEGDKNGKITFISTRGASAIDLALAETEMMAEGRLNLTIGMKTTSTHMPIEVEWAIETENMRSTKKKQEVNTLKKYRWKEKYREDYIERKNDEISEIMKIGVSEAIKAKEIDVATSRLTTYFEYIGKKMEVRDQGPKKTRQNEWFDTECKLLKQKTKEALREFRIEKEEKKLKEYIKIRKEYRATCRKKIEEEKRLHMNELERAADEKNTKEFWKIIKNKVKRKSTAISDIAPEDWIRHFSEMFKERGKCTERDNESHEEQRVELLDARILESEVEKIIKELKNGKAAGSDGIPNELIKYHDKRNELHKILADLFNKIMELNKWPKEWNVGIIQPIHKKGDASKPENYRGITLLPTVSKIMTKIITIRLQTWLEENNKISMFQAGFRQGYSTIDNVIVFNTIIERTINKKKRELYTCFVDFKTAFDSINRDKLWGKLEKIGISNKIINFIKAVYYDTEAKVKTDSKETTQTFKVRAGVRQGCQLSAILFMIYVNDIPDFIKSSVDNIHEPYIRKIGVPLLMYADDIVLVSESPIGLQRQLRKLEEYACIWDLEVNTSKTKTMVFTKNKRKCGLQWTYSGEKLENVDNYNYLGLKVNKNMDWKKHIEEVTTSANRKLAPLRKLYYSNEEMSVKTMKKIFDAIIEPVMLYGSEIWSMGNKVLKCDKVIQRLAKEMLGVKITSANNAAIAELGWIKTSWKAKQRGFNKLWKMEKENNKILQKECILQMKREKSDNWVQRTNNELKAIDVIGEIQKEKLREVIRKEQNKELENNITNMSTLIMIQHLGKEEKEEEYTKTNNRKIRSAVAGLRLGTKRWRREKNEEGIRLCQLCNETDHPNHYPKDCKGLEDVRNGMWEESWSEMYNGGLEGWRKIQKMLAIAEERLKYYE